MEETGSQCVRCTPIFCPWFNQRISSDAFCCDSRVSQLRYCIAAHAFLEENADAAKVTAHRELCHSRFPIAAAFASEEETTRSYEEHVGAVAIVQKVESTPESEVTSEP